MRRNLAAFVIASTAIFSGAAAAATKDLTKAIFAAIPWDENMPDLSQRKRFASAIEAYWLDFDARVPRLSPKEQEWIESELAAQGERVSRAMNSKEYALWSINRHTDLCLDTIRNVIKSYETEQSQKVEMFYWVKMINCYDGSGDLRSSLDQMGIRHDDDAGEQIQTTPPNLPQEIIVNKVIPMAMAETMGWTLGD